MTTKAASFKVQIFIPELPRPEGQRVFRTLQADDSADAIRRVLNLTCPNGHNPCPKPKLMFVIAERLDEGGRG